MKKPIGIMVCVLALLVLASAVACGSLLNPTTTTASTTSTVATTTTTTEAPASWAQAEPSGATPSARCYQAMVYEPTSQRVLMLFGFNGTNALKETWAYDATANGWTDLKTASKAQPSAAEQIPATFVASINKVVAYDGTTWGYDVAGNSWKALGPKGDKLKPGRVGASMVLDANTGKVILFGGTDRSKCYNETWSYDPAANTWTNLKPQGELPTGRNDAGMAYDPTSGKIFLFGGVDGEFTCLNDTWSYDPTANTWTKLTTEGSVPSARSGLGMEYDPHSKKIVLFGGIDSQLVCYNDTWAFDPAEGDWTQLQPVGSSPMPRGRCALVYAADIDMMVLFGGATVQADSSGGFGAQVYLNDTWIFGVDPKPAGSGTTTTDATVTPAATSTTLGAGSTSSTLR